MQARKSMNSQAKIDQNQEISEIKPIHSKESFVIKLMQKAQENTRKIN